LYANSSDWGAIVGYGSLNLYSNTLFNNTGTTYSTLRMESAINYPTKGNFYNNLFLSNSSLRSVTTYMVTPQHGRNLATDGSCSGFSTATYAAIRGVAPDYNGGLTRNMAIQAGSSAIDIGNTAGCQNANLNNRDQARLCPLCRWERG